MNAQEEITTAKTKSRQTMFGLKIPNNKMFRGYSFWSLLISNLIIILIVLLENQSVLSVLWVYWFQSVIIGVFNFIKIISLNDFTIDGLKMNGHLLTKSRSAKIGVAVFFLIHYGFFHLVYAVFLSAFISIREISTGGIDFSFILLTSMIFAVNYLGEFIFTFRREQTSIQSLPKLMMTPYKRIIPMHLTIILSGFVLAGGVFTAGNSNMIILLIFTGLKTFIDLVTSS